MSQWDFLLGASAQTKILFINKFSHTELLCEYQVTLFALVQKFIFLPKAASLVK